MVSTLEIVALAACLIRFDDAMDVHWCKPQVYECISHLKGKQPVMGDAFEIAVCVPERRK